jgi:hypothetical protein
VFIDIIKKGGVMKDKYKELDYIFSKENKYKDEDDIPMKLNEKQQRKIMKDNPTQGFDICSKCDNERH